MPALCSVLPSATAVEHQAMLLQVLAYALSGQDVTVELKNGVAIHGRLSEFDDEGAHVTLDNIRGSVRRVAVDDAGVERLVEEGCPPHLAHLTRLRVRGSAIRHLDFDASRVKLDALSQAAVLN